MDQIIYVDRPVRIHPQSQRNHNRIEEINTVAGHAINEINSNQRKHHLNKNSQSTQRRCQCQKNIHYKFSFIAIRT